ncbi:hypothetical protein N7539_008588 [Penicillium diatomitis]|uniref:Uncharacterized protein n=1 Tax=Penicillium diatomitis TaxID=2819901 RepID=A0A9W9WR24_9EURO|nr:uncharacterized protein N7539_008588 [Penicillium diatomitis]KAJ5472019.1 hypothetical protein N7539_008588 [Penicillium diatomitis]
MPPRTGYSSLAGFEIDENGRGSWNGYQEQEQDRGKTIRASTVCVQSEVSQMSEIGEPYEITGMTERAARTVESTQVFRMVVV